MPTNVNINGVTRQIPKTGESSWGPSTTELLQAIVNAAIFTGSGVSKPLVADLDLGPNFGIKTAYIASRTTPAGSTGLVRLANGDVITWRNAANNGNISVAVNGQDMLTIDGKAVVVNNDGGTPTKKVAFDSSAATASTTTTFATAATVNQTVTIPDGSFTVAKNSDLTDHVGDTTGAHAGSAISNTPSGNLAATDVQGALNELQSDVDTRALASDLSNHLSDTTGAHAASTISSVASGNLAATDVQAALNELQSDVDTRALASDLSNHLSDTVDAHDASAISVVPVGNLAATEVQAALQELQGDVDGRVNGLGTVTDNRLVKTSGTDGKSLEQTSISVDDSNNMTGVVDITSTGTVQGNIIKAKDRIDILDSNDESHTAQITLPDISENIQLTLPNASGRFATVGGVETFTNKYINGGTASATNAILLPQKAGESGPTAATGSVFLDTTANKVKAYYNSKWNVIGGGLITEAKGTGNFTAEAGKWYLVDMSGASANSTITLPAGVAEAVIQVSVKNNPYPTYKLIVDGAGAETIYYNSTAQTTVEFGYPEMTATFAWDSIDSHWVVAVSQTPLSGTWSGNFPVSGTIQADTIESYTASGRNTFTRGVIINESGADSDTRIEGDTDQNLFFVDASTDRVGIGTSTPSTKFEVYTSSGIVGQSITSLALADSQNSFIQVTGRRSGSSDRSVTFGVYKHSGITETCGYMGLGPEDGGSNNFFWVDNSDQFRTSTTASHIGTTSGTVVGTQTSDERTKDNIAACRYGLETVLCLKPIEYDQWGIHKVGFSAQETLKVIPEAVFDTKENIDDSENTKLGMEYVQIVPVLVKAIQEQQAQIEQLKADIATLRGE
jgi:hypothetical protein